MARNEKALKTREWASISMPIEYIDYILEAARRSGGKGCVSDFVRDAVREKLAGSRINAPKYDTLFERFGVIPG